MKELPCDSLGLLVARFMTGLLNREGLRFLLYIQGADRQSSYLAGTIGDDETLNEIAKAISAYNDEIQARTAQQGGPA